MNFRKVLFVMLAAVWLAGMANAQNSATLIGTVADESNAVHPGTAVTATENSTGQQYTATSDERGVYRIVEMQPGTYRVQATQTGFSTLVVSNVQLLVGQTVSLPLTLKVASVATTVEVQSEAELINTETQEVGGNINRLQMDEIPLLGRNVQDLSLLVKGITANSTNNNSYGAARDDLFQINLDGQQITQAISIAASFGEPVMSRDAVAEFQLVTNQFDITQGRSSGEQVNVISRSGTNQLHGTVYGNFRRDEFNASDFVAHKVLPYQDTIIGATIGGPVVKDKLHYFFSYEHQSTPSTIFIAPVAFALLASGQNNITLPTPNTQYNALARGDYTINEKNTRTFRLLLRAWERNGLDAFGGRYCGYSTMEGVKSALQRLVADTGIAVTTYSFRHKVTTVLRKSGVPEDQVSAILGHKRPNLRTTAGYGEYAPDYQKEAAAALENWFWKIVKLARKIDADGALNSRDTPDNVRTRNNRAA